MWVNRFGDNFTSKQVCDAIARMVGASFSRESLEATYAIGSIYKNGSVWFQRLS
jgi:hypothetical protein